MLTLVTDTSTLAVSLTSLKSHLAITSSAEDTRLTALIYSSQKAIENMVDGSIVLTPTVYDWTIPKFYSSKIFLPQPPLNTLTSIKYYDTSNDQQTMDTSLYYVVNSTYSPAFVKVKDSWVSTYDRPDAIVFRFTSGFSTVPPDLAHCVLMLAASWNENREAEVAGTISTEIKLGVDRVLRGWNWGIYC